MILSPAVHKFIFYDHLHYSQMAMTRRDYIHLRNHRFEEVTPLNRQRLTKLLTVEDQLAENLA